MGLKILKGRHEFFLRWQLCHGLEGNIYAPHRFPCTVHQLIVLAIHSAHSLWTRYGDTSAEGIPEQIMLVPNWRLASANVMPGSEDLIDLIVSWHAAVFYII